MKKLKIGLFMLGIVIFVVGTHHNNMLIVWLGISVSTWIALDFKLNK